jgi:hypothetical protein
LFRNIWHSFKRIVRPDGVGEALLDRAEAMALLKELIAVNMVDPSFVSLSQRMPNHYELQIKSDYYRSELEAYAKKFGLSIEEDKQQKYLVIFKP